MFGIAGGNSTGSESSFEPMLSFPKSAGPAVRAEATVAFVSNGYVRGGCKTMKSSGHQLADQQACRTVSFFKSSEPIYSITSVWIPPKFDGHYIPPKLKNSSRVINAETYPSNALRKGHQGTSTVRLYVDVNGKVSDCQVAQSSGHKSLDKVTCKSLLKARYNPATLNGVPIESVVYSPIAWGAGSGPPKNRKD
jgi:TonB family protein